MENTENREAMVTSTIRVPRRIWLALRHLAELKAMQAGGRASASAIVAELVAAEVARESREAKRA